MGGVGATGGIQVMGATGARGRTIDVTAVGRSFADPVGDAQRCFRRILAAMSEPGSRTTLEATIDVPAFSVSSVVFVLSGAAK